VQFIGNYVHNCGAECFEMACDKQTSAESVAQEDILIAGNILDYRGITKRAPTYAVMPNMIASLRRNSESTMNYSGYFFNNLILLGDQPLPLTGGYDMGVMTWRQGLYNGSQTPIATFVMRNNVIVITHPDSYWRMYAIRTTDQYYDVLKLDSDYNIYVVEGCVNAKGMARFTQVSNQTIYSSLTFQQLVAGWAAPGGKTCDANSRVLTLEEFQEAFNSDGTPVPNSIAFTMAARTPQLSYSFDGTPLHMSPRMGAL
jgi:hypothetical protein